MRKIIIFCRGHLAEMLYGLAIVGCITASVGALFYFSGFEAWAAVFMGVLLQAILGYYIQKLERGTFLPSLNFARVWFVGFMIMAVALVAAVISDGNSWVMSFLCTLLILWFVAFVASFGFLLIIADVVEGPEYDGKRNV